jgi:aryl-alcohol dehydrogenase-like predicted oxidoreductase
LTSADVTRDLEQSLKTLGTDTIDLYLLHYDDPAAPIEPLVDTLNRHLAAGKVRAIGVSNWPTRRIAAAADYAARAGRTPFVASSVQFSLASWQRTPWPNALSISGDEAEAERRWYRDQRLYVLAYSSLAMGFFSRSRPYAGGQSATPAKADRFGDQVFVNDRNLARLARATDLAAQRGVSPGQIALAWVLRYDPRVLALVGARTVASYVDAVKAFDVPLSESEREWLSHGP